MTAQERQNNASDRVATQKNGKDLKDYSKKAELLTAMRTVQSRLGVYQSQNTFIADKLSTQDTMLNQARDAVTRTRATIADALATDRGDTLMEELQGQLRDAIEGLNARYGGKYLFAGGQIDTRPVTATALTDLTAGPPIASFFANDNFKAQAMVDDSTLVTTGLLASDVGTDLLTAYKAMQTFHEGVGQAFTGQLTAAQRTFLQGQLASWDTVRADLTNVVARNGLVQRRVDSVKQDLVSRGDSLDGMIIGITDADMPKAIADLEAAKLAVQASAKVFTSLQASSLLNYLK
jgi:flagellar hook-associated protein 3 FlgL